MFLNIGLLSSQYANLDLNVPEWLLLSCYLIRIFHVKIINPYKIFDFVVLSLMTTEDSRIF